MHIVSMALSAAAVELRKGARVHVGTERELTNQSFSLKCCFCKRMVKVCFRDLGLHMHHLMNLKGLEDSREGRNHIGFHNRWLQLPLLVQMMLACNSGPVHYAQPHITH